MSCNCICNGPCTAKAMKYSRKYLEMYTEQLVDLQKKGKLPNLKAKLEYNVYSIRGSSIDAHQSIVLSTNNKDFVTVELGFQKENNDTYVKPVTKSLDERYESKLEFKGIVQTTGVILITKAVIAMKQFGSYCQLFNNCRSFCTKYLEEIGLSYGGHKILTDSAKDEAGLKEILSEKLS